MTSATTSVSNKSKTVYLIRHAESEENRRLGSLKTAVKGLTKCVIPSKNDVYASLELLNVSAQIDSDVSPKGKEQIEQLGKRLTKDSFITKTGIQLVAHSPLKRARQTSHGMLQTVTSTSLTVFQDSSSNGAKHPSISRVLELDLLSERTPKEWLPTHYNQYRQRIQEFEEWICDQDENVIAIVGHSQYFRSMLGLKSKFGNVDVWKVDLDVDAMKDRLSNSNEEVSKNGDEKKEVDGDDEKMSTTSIDQEPIESGIVTEVDGIPLEDLELPMGWSELKHLYRYDPDYKE